MPIVQVTALRQRVGVDLDVVARAIADAVSRELEIADALVPASRPVQAKSTA